MTTIERYSMVAYCLIANSGGEVRAGELLRDYVTLYHNMYDVGVNEAEIIAVTAVEYLKKNNIIDADDNFSTILGKDTNIRLNQNP